MTEIEWDKNDGNRVERKGSGRFYKFGNNRTKETRNAKGEKLSNKNGDFWEWRKDMDKQQKRE